MVVLSTVFLKEMVMTVFAIVEHTMRKHAFGVSNL